MKAMLYTTILGGNMDWGPIVGTIIALAGMFFALVMGYYIGYNDAKDGK